MVSETRATGAEQQSNEGGRLLGVGELAENVGLSVRTVRYYATLGLLPPPVRRGRTAFYSQRHLARLELIRALQDHGFTLAAIERFLSRVPADADTDDLDLERALLTSGTGRGELVTRRELDARAGRRLDATDLVRLEDVQAVRRDGDRFEVLPPFEVGLQVLDLPDVPVTSVLEAAAAITRHMDALADELSAILRSGVLAPFRGRPHTAAEQARFDQTVRRLRQLTTSAVVAGFQRAANQVISRSLHGPD